jgi:hypothetical protein
MGTEEYLVFAGRKYVLVTKLLLLLLLLLGVPGVARDDQ